MIIYAYRLPVLVQQQKWLAFALFMKLSQKALTIHENFQLINRGKVCMPLKLLNSSSIYIAMTTSIKIPSLF